MVVLVLEVAIADAFDKTDSAEATSSTPAFTRK